MDQYHNEVHRSLGMTPLEKWKLGLRSCRVFPREPENKERYRQDFLCFVEPDGKRVIERDGVHFKELVYYASELEILSRYEHNKQKKYYIRYDPSDMRYLYIYDDDRNCYYRLFLKSRPKNPFSINELESTRKSIKDKVRSQANEYLVMETIIRRRDLIESIRTDKKVTLHTAAERRIRQVKNSSADFSSLKEKSIDTTTKFCPQLIDVNSVKIIRLDEDGL